MPSSDCCFLTCIQISQEAGQVVWCSRPSPSRRQQKDWDVSNHHLKNESVSHILGLLLGDKCTTSWRLMNVRKRRSNVSLLTHVCLMQSQVSLCWWFSKSRVQPQSNSLLEMLIVKPLLRHTQLEALEALRWLPCTLKFENNCFSLHLPLHSKTPHLLSSLKSYSSFWADSIITEALRI